MLPREWDHRRRSGTPTSGSGPFAIEHEGIANGETVQAVLLSSVEIVAERSMVDLQSFLHSLVIIGLGIGENVYGVAQLIYII